MIGEHSNFQKTALRVSRPPIFAKPIVVSSDQVRFIVAEQLQSISIEADIVLEPSRRDSAAAVAAATVLAARHNPEQIILVLAADHVIYDGDAFVAACEQAIKPSHLGFIITLGVKPTRPFLMGIPDKGT